MKTFSILVFLFLGMGYSSKSQLIVIDSTVSKNYSEQTTIGEKILDHMIRTQSLNTDKLERQVNETPFSIKMVDFMNRQFNTKLFSDFNIAKYTQFKYSDSSGVIAFQILEIGFKNSDVAKKVVSLVSKDSTYYFKTKQLTRYKMVSLDKNVIFLITQTTREKRVKSYITDFKLASIN